MYIEIKKANQLNINEANKLLTKLIRDEKKYDHNINEKYVVKRYYENRPKNSVILFAYVDKKIAGYTYGILEDTQTYINKKLLIDALYVEEEFRNNGVATSLINAVEEWGKEQGAKVEELTVCKENEKAFNLYKKFGFDTIVYRMTKNI